MAGRVEWTLAAVEDVESLAEFIARDSVVYAGTLVNRLLDAARSLAHSVREVIAAARRVTGREIPAEVGPRREGDPAVLVAGSAKIRRELGWTPRCGDLETIVRTAWAWHSRHPEGYGE